jgi:hypothetical protein
MWADPRKPPSNSRRIHSRECDRYAGFHVLFVEAEESPLPTFEFATRVLAADFDLTVDYCQTFREF